MQREFAVSSSCDTSIPKELVLAEDIATVAPDRLSSNGSEFILEVRLVEVNVTNALLDQVLAHPVQFGLVLGREDDDRGVIGESIKVEGFGSLDAGMTGLNGLLWGGKVFTSEDVDIRVALNLGEGTEPVENRFDHDWSPCSTFRCQEA